MRNCLTAERGHQHGEVGVLEESKRDVCKLGSKCRAMSASSGPAGLHREFQDYIIETLFKKQNSVCCKTAAPPPARLWKQTGWDERNWLSVEGWCLTHWRQKLPSEQHHNQWGMWLPESRLISVQWPIFAEGGQAGSVKSLPVVRRGLHTYGAHCIAGWRLGKGT